MSKAKLYLLIAAVLVCSMAFAAPALAWTHGQFSATTDACAGCHVAHAAQAPNLLKQGPTQTHFCFLCHGDGGASAPYDVKVGITKAGSNTYASTACGFERWAGTDGPTVTSRHNVWGYSMGNESDGLDQGAGSHGPYEIPGGTNTFTGSGFVCASCHDPHDGGTVPDANGYVKGDATHPNPRLLRRSFTFAGGTTVPNVYMKFHMVPVGDFVYKGVTSGVYKVDQYWVDYDAGDGTYYGSSYWCGGCHDKFKAELPGMNFGVMTKHPTFGHAVLPDGANGSILYGTPLEYDDDTVAGLVYRVGCLTCHRAHATTAKAIGWASEWPRDGGGTSTTSALLRMDNRGVCYNCHGAAKYNCINDTREVSGSAKCSTCHPS
ncbi:MAG: cytochrome c3 family protein [Bacillota bacterium]